jgi:broad specificity phosphatase PhoE
VTQDAHDAEEQTNREAADRADIRTAAQRVPGSFDVAFLSGAENVTELLLVRHGQQEFDPAGPVAQLLDPPLSQLGQQQARLVGAHLSTQRIDVVYASPLKRALETGREIARQHRMEPIVVDDLREVGIFDQIPHDRTPLDFVGRQVLAGARQRMVEEKSWDVYPHSESSAGFRKRVLNAIEGIIATHQNQRVAIACHGGVINAYVGHIIGSKYDMFFRPAHTSINTVGAGGNIRALFRLNEALHLETPEGSFYSV